ncbi:MULTISPECIES: hypothetical protein [unclassified Paenibacillus]|uniref:hypothetical protein n=1 Tax=unclassified Paenibacillus TaxID=185978 RepID=UPI001AEAB7E0|nr:MULTISPECIES: hypothetical protein [unclassified Paenibacillus]MBP1154006.1 hypothetical protein [Paenibacillus sp. PvP091]MBP1170609.1 hypothetical protein [Paenibacillus sp. PvR098]MBP2441637.1 hypothetical protein [Paenibacillus sp. PvP052]
MISEIHNKISSTGSNLSERLEDKLTGDFFGTLRYLSFELGFRNVLSQVRFETDESKLQWKLMLDRIRGYDMEYRFWPSHPEGEIDLLIDHPETLIGIEVKYLSSLSSEDEDPLAVIKPEESRNQLARYARMIHSVGADRQKFLVFLAPLDILLPVERTMRNRPIIRSDISLGFLSWQEVLESLQELDTGTLEIGQRLILKDITDLLLKKGFVRFRGFSSGLETIELNDSAYHYQGKRQRFETLVWPENPIKENKSYVYRK